MFLRRHQSNFCVAGMCIDPDVTVVTDQGLGERCFKNEQCKVSIYPSWVAHNTECLSTTSSPVAVAPNCYVSRQPKRVARAQVVEPVRSFENEGRFVSFSF